MFQRFHISLPARIEFLDQFIKAVSTCAQRFCFEEEKVMGIKLAVEEVFVNIARYAYPDATGDVEIYCAGEKESFVIEIIDRGVPFDVTSLPDPDITAVMDERKVGGLGVHLVKHLADDIHYERSGDTNILKLTFNKTSTKATKSGR